MTGILRALSWWYEYHSSAHATLKTVINTMDNRVLSSLIAPIQLAMGSHRVHWRGSQELESFWQLAASLKLPQVELEQTAALEKTPAYETNGSWKDFRNNGFDGIDEQSQTSILTICMRKGFNDCKSVQHLLSHSIMHAELQNQDFKFGN